MRLCIISITSTNIFNEYKKIQNSQQMTVTEKQQACYISTKFSGCILFQIWEKEVKANCLSPFISHLWYLELTTAPLSWFNSKLVGKKMLRISEPLLFWGLSSVKTFIPKQHCGYFSTKPSRVEFWFTSNDHLIIN